eukprot:IDg22625t1
MTGGKNPIIRKRSGSAVAVAAPVDESSDPEGLFYSNDYSVSTEDFLSTDQELENVPLDLQEEEKLFAILASGVESRQTTKLLAPPDNSHYGPRRSYCWKSALSYTCLEVPYENCIMTRCYDKKYEIL